MNPYDLKDDLQTDDAKNNRTLVEFESDMQRADSHICENCGALLSERIIKEIRRIRVDEKGAQARRENGKKGGRPRKADAGQ